MFKFSSVPAYSIGSRPRQAPGLDVPGPGSYQVDTSSKIQVKKSPGVVLGSSKRDTNNRNDMPGPGAYDATSNIFSKPKGGYMGGRKDLKLYMDTPGPGAYAMQGGDGSYSKKNGGYSFGKGRGDLAQGSVSPGPGAYSVDDPYGKPLNRSTGNVLARAARSSMKTDEIPGPGTYDYGSSALLRDNRGAKLGKAPRGDLINKTGAEVGPGGYAVPREFDNMTKPGGKFDQGPRQIIREDGLPGPGQYDAGSAYDRVTSHHGGSPSSNVSGQVW